MPGQEPLLMVDFNPRSHEGSDQENLSFISIQRNFNPRSHEGSDEDFMGDMHNKLKDFNPRSHEGSDFSGV